MIFIYFKDYLLYLYNLEINWRKSDSQKTKLILLDQIAMT